MKSNNQFLKHRKAILQNIILTRDDARLVKNKYRVIAGVIQKLFPEMKEIEQSELEHILFHAINADRDWRKMTEDYDRDMKEELEHKWLDENGYAHRDTL
jgi:hypothetical protein